MRRIWPRREALPSRLIDDERGDVAVSVLLIPLAFLAVFGTIHFALVFHGRNVAAAAAQDGFFTAAQFGANAEDGENAARATLGLFPGIVADPEVDVDKNDNVVTVTVKGEIATPLNFFSGFDVTVTGPPERFYTESERNAIN